MISQLILASLFFQTFICLQSGYYIIEDSRVQGSCLSVNYKKPYGQGRKDLENGYFLTSSDCSTAFQANNVFYWNKTLDHWIIQNERMCLDIYQGVHQQKVKVGVFKTDECYRSNILTNYKWLTIKFGDGNFVIQDRFAPEYFISMGQRLGDIVSLSKEPFFLNIIAVKKEIAAESKESGLGD